jgi:hypothetical protein
MKLFYVLLTAMAMVLTVPTDANAAKKDAKKDAKKEEKKEMLYTAVITPNLGSATEAQVTEVKALLMLASDFKCKDVKLEGKEIVATLSVDKGRLSKSIVSKPLGKDFKVGKVDDVKPEKEKKDKKDPKADPKKDEKKDDKKDEKKEEMKPGDKPADAKTPEPKK